MAILTFDVSEEIRAMFDLTALILHADRNKTFERIIRDYTSILTSKDADITKSSETDGVSSACETQKNYLKNEKILKEVNELISVGKQRGSLTFNEIDEKIVMGCEATADELDEVFRILQDNGIEIDDIISDAPIKVYSKKINSVDSKALRRMKFWARKPWQLNHQCIRAFLQCAQGDEADWYEMQKIFMQNTGCSAHQFDINLVSMSTDSGNSHGRVFELIGTRVILVKEVKWELKEYEKYFKGE